MLKAVEREANILVTGGAGYVGSHACKVLAKAGFRPVVYDDLSVGLLSAVRWGPFVRAGLQDKEALKFALREYEISAVMHFAASAYVGESVKDPSKYFNNNVVNTIGLLDCMVDAGIKQFVFSSTCAIYGNPEQLPIKETHPTQPINPYGESKLIIEKVLGWYAKAYHLKSVSLRYFNAAGADPLGEAGESHEHETHLIPLALEAALSPERPVSIFGSQYSTPDGTAVRDYTHVSDLADAHKLALEYLNQGGETAAFNLGSGKGHSVSEVISAVERVTGRKVYLRESAARSGDPATLVADSSLARQQLGWECRHSDLTEIIETAWRWRLADPMKTPNSHLALSAKT